MEAGGGLVLCLVTISMQMVVGVSSPPAMYVFGDSILDVGNNDYLPGPGVSRANHPYYGIDYPLSIPTGRFSNGYNTADYAAMSMGFAAGSPPPFLSLLAHGQGTSLLAITALSIGVSYASGGAGILNSTNAGNTIPLSEQVRYFRDTRARMMDTRGSSAVNSLLSRSVFLICIGNNDMLAYAQQNNQQSDAAAAFYSSLISVYSATIKELYRMGARRFAIINLGLIGCVPVERLLSPTAACSDGMNQLVAGFNEALESMLADLAKKKQLPGMAYSLGDTYGLTEDTFANPEASGYTDITSACCGTGRLNAETTCTPSSMLCANRAQHVFWDHLHPSQRAAFLTIKAFYDGPAQYTKPINFEQLVHTST